MRLEDDWLLLEDKNRLIDRLPSLDDAQKAQMKRFFAKRPSLESRFDWNRPDTITWDSFQSIANGYEEPIDPDTVPELSDKRDEGNGIVSYEVQDDKRGQFAMRRIIDTHWGKDANPWCLLARTGGKFEPTEDFRGWVSRRGDRLTQGNHIRLESMYEHETGKPATLKIGRNLEDDYALSYWNQYSALPKRVAFKDGRLMAFMANDFNPYYTKELRDSILREHPEYNKEFAVYRTSNGILLRVDAEKQFLEWLESAHPEYKIKHREKWWDRNDNPHHSVHDCV